MTYAAIETSGYSGQPGEYFAFTVGSNVYRYTSSDADITVDGFLYLSIPLERNAFKQGAEINNSLLEVSLPINASIGQEFIAGPPSVPIEVTISRKHTSDAQIITPFIGTVVNFNFTEETLILTCQSVLLALKRSLLIRAFQVACPYDLYGVLCAVNKASFQEAATLSSVSGTALTSSDFASFTSGYFSGGYLEYNEGSRTITRSIISHVSTAVELNYPIPGLPGRRKRF